MPQIAVINESTDITDAEVQSYLPAFSQQWNQDLLPVWGVDAATFAFVPANQTPAAGTWWVVFLDDSDQAGALAYHDLTDEGLPISKVFVKTIKADNGSVSVGATHEICEMAVDPWLNSAYQDAQGVFWAGEVCDPVEDDQYGYDIGGVLVTDFVTPNWFGHQHSQTNIDLKGHANAAFEVLTGGYAQKFDPQSGWQQVTGSMAKRSRRAAHAPEGSRRERRARQWTSRHHSGAHANAIELQPYPLRSRLPRTQGQGQGTITRVRAVSDQVERAQRRLCGFLSFVTPRNGRPEPFIGLRAAWSS